MASLKEIRARINSVTSTRKITSAMKMVSAAKLRKAEDMTLRFLPYQNSLQDVLSRYLASLDAETVSIPLSIEREVKNIAIIAISSSSGLCGTFNGNITKLLQKVISEYQGKNITIYPIGKKIADFAKKLDYEICTDYIDLAEKIDYDKVISAAKVFTTLFLEQKIDKVVFLYNHYKNAGVQVPTVDQFLPIKTEAKKGDKNAIYFAEPDGETFINDLMPLVVRMKFYATLLDSLTAEHGARTTAMQIASENAEKLIGEITLQYNRARQEQITNELIDIVGGSEALK